MRVFYAHPSSESVKSISEDIERLSTLFSARGGRDIRVVPGRQDFDKHFKGNWDAWAESIVTRTHSVTRKRQYDIVVVPGQRCGRITAKIIHVALKRDRPVFAWDRDQSLKRVQLVTVSNPDDWATGSSLIIRGE